MHKDLNPAAAPAADALRRRARPSSMPTGCRSRRAASSRARRACSAKAEGHALLDARRPPGARRQSPACGASTPATAGRRSSRAIAEQAAEMDFAPPFNMGAPERVRARRAARRHRARRASTSVFFTNSGSEAVDTALKMAIAYHRARGEGQRTRLIGRERGYHGVNFGGISVGGIAGNRKSFGTMRRRRRPPAPHPRPAEERLLARPARARRRARRRPRAHRRAARRLDHRRGDRRAGRRLDRRAGAAARATSQRLRAICDKHGILLIFDEVITGFGRLGTPFARRALRRHARPDDRRQGHHQRLRADGRGVRRRRDPRRLHDGPGARDRVLPRLHLLRRIRSPAPPALGTLETYADEGLLTRGARWRRLFEHALHSLRESPHVDRHAQHRPGRRASSSQSIAGAPGKRALRRLPRRASSAAC